MEDVDKEISEMKLSLNARARIVAESYLVTVNLDLLIPLYHTSSVLRKTDMEHERWYVFFFAVLVNERMTEADKEDGKKKVEVVVLTKNGGFGLYRR
jgi:hypothetical protein